MTTAHHTPHPFGGPLTSVAMEGPLGQLDAAIETVIATGSGASTTLTAQANAGQKNMVVASGTNFPNGAVFWIGDPGGTRETGVIASGGGTTTLVATVNLANTYAIGKPVSVSPVELVDARGGYTTLGGRLTGRFGYMLNAKEFGAIGDGTVNDTAALQAALDALIAAPTIAGLFIPPGTYKITAALSIGTTAYQYKSIFGAGRGITTIRQDTSNLAVFQTATEDTHSIRFGEMTLTYNTQQTSANTAAYGLLFKRASGAGIGNGWYWWRVANLEISKAHIAIGIGGPGATGQLPVWNSSFDGIFTSNISMSLLRLVSPTAAGMPVNTFRQWTHINQTTAPAGPAIEIAGAESRFDGLDLEDWTGRLIWVIGGGDVTISGLHVERHNLNSTSALVEIADGALVIDGSYYDFQVTGGVAAVLWRVSGGSFHVRGARLICTLTSGTINGLVRAAVATNYAIEISGVTQDFNNVPIDSTWEATGTRAVGDAAGVTTLTANLYYFTAFAVRGTRRVSTVRFLVVTQAGNYDIAIFDEFGNRLAQTGSIAVPAAGVATQALVTPVLLHPGRKYYAALVGSSATAAFAFKASSSAAHAAAIGLAVDQAGSAPPFPSTVSIAGTGSWGRQYAIDFF